MNAIVQVKAELSKLESGFVAALPKHIDQEYFMRVLQTTIQDNPNLVRCDRQSLWSSAMKAAQDGLIPDGREGAIVAYKSKSGLVAQWMPMIAGLRKKVRNSGEIATWDVHAVYENDEFEYQLGDNPKIMHKPTLGDPGNLIAVYSIAVLKSGEVSRDVMSISAVEKIKSKSKAQYGPWSDPVFYPEMAKKTVARRHSKVLPMSTDVNDFLRRDDDTYGIELPTIPEADPRKAASGLNDRLAALADTVADDPLPDTSEAEDIDPDTGEVMPNDQADNDDDGLKTSAIAEKVEADTNARKAAAEAKADLNQPEKKPEPSQEAPAEPDEANDDPDWYHTETYDDEQIAAHDGGVANRRRGMARDVVPRKYNEEKRLLIAYQVGWDAGGDDA